MYFPFLRGKQFELMALREAATDLAASGKVWPVIEPVRDRFDSLERCLSVLGEQGLQLSVVINPAEGDLARDERAPERLLEVIAQSPRPELIHPCLLVTAQTDIVRISDLLKPGGYPHGAVDLAHVEFSAYAAISSLASKDSNQFIESKRVLRRYEPEPSGRRVVWDDHFLRRRNNLEYVDAQRSLFTDDTIYFIDENLDGFADYATIGRGYTEGGSAPRAVVIHLTFPDERGRIWIRHFASISNEDTADPAGKFGEAVAKVVRFADEINLSNPAIDVFRAHAERGSYPGLGVVKKLSILNHLYVVMGVLDR